MKLRRLHEKQRLIHNSKAKRKIIRAGRRGGKTTYAGYETTDAWLHGKRVLYAVPTGDQLEKWWFEVCRSLGVNLYNSQDEAFKQGILYINKTEHRITRAGTEIGIRGKTAWNAATLRGDHADLLILDEVQLMAEDIWGEVGAPMLMDNDGDAIFIYTPPSIRSRSISKATDKMWMKKFAKAHKDDATGRWEVFTFTSHDNPYISQVAVNDMAKDMTFEALQQEIEAKEFDENPHALWTRETIEKSRLAELPKEKLEHAKSIYVPIAMDRIVVAIDPTGTVTGDKAGIIVAGQRDGEDYLLEDLSMHAKPEQWAATAASAYWRWKADVIVAEKNFGGDMVESTIRVADPTATVKLVNASRGKIIRAEPVSVRYTQGKVHHVGVFEELEDQQCLWMVGDPSPNNLDALVWSILELEGMTDFSDLEGLGSLEDFKSKWTERFGDED